MNNTGSFRVGIIGYGLEREFARDLIELINSMPPVTDKEGRSVKIDAGHIKIREITFGGPSDWDMVIDRSSYLYPFALGMFFEMLHRGVYFVNNPLTFEFWINHKFLTYSIIESLGVPVPPTFLLPPHSQSGLDTGDTDFHEPYDWDRVERMLGYPMVMKPNPGREAMNVHFVHSREELFRTYNGTGTEVMTLQKTIKPPEGWFVRCLCVGRKILPIKYKFGFGDTSSYIFEENFLPPDTGRKITEYSMVINRALGLEMNSIEYMIDSDGVPWAIDFDNPVPDGRRNALGEIFYRDYQEALAELTRHVCATGRRMAFLPSEVNSYIEISRKNIGREEKFSQALELASKYYI